MVHVATGKGVILHCFVHLIASGREVYRQSGSNLDAFTKDLFVVCSNPGTTTLTDGGAIY